MNGPAKDPDTALRATIVEPTAEQARNGSADLETCLPYWKETPALLVIKPDLRLIVAVLGSEHDHMGFTLCLGVQEILEAPPGFDKSELDISCVWNQPYLAFDRSKITAAYSFYLHFGVEGVARVRELYKSIDPEKSGSPDQTKVALVFVFACFRPRATPPK